MKQAKVITDEEMKRLLAVISQERHGARDRFAFMLSYYAGLRVGEIAALNMDDIFHENGNVREFMHLRAETTKTNDARAVFLNPILLKEARRYLMSCRRTVNPKPLILSQKNTRFSANSLCQRFGELYFKAGITGASSHSGRRWFITRLAHRGISAKVIMTLAGHRNLSTTQRYIEVNDEMLRAAVETL